jgi:hypothetical protein
MPLFLLAITTHGACEGDGAAGLTLVNLCGAMVGTGEPSGYVIVTSLTDCFCCNSSLSAELRPDKYATATQQSKTMVMPMFRVDIKFQERLEFR